MKPTTSAAATFCVFVAAVNALPKPGLDARDVYTNYPYKGPTIPVGDFVDSTVKGNGKGFIRLVESPAVQPGIEEPSNNINVISLAYVPGGANVHFQTPFGLGTSPSVHWGVSSASLSNTATGSTSTYDRTPPCSLATVTQCSQFFHDVQIIGLSSGTTYYYQIQAANGTTVSKVMQFTTALAAGDSTPFSIGVLVDMGYTNAKGTYQQLLRGAQGNLSFAWHGGDLSYADDWYTGIIACSSDDDVCYNGTSSSLPPGDYDEDYNIPLPAGEIPDQGSPEGGDMSPLYESNWDLWQQWMNNITTAIPYMVSPGNHEASCAEFDGAGANGPNVLSAYLDNDEPDSTASSSSLTYYSCPPSQRNFTAFQHRFRMPGAESSGVGNFWYSFDYGLAHFISLSGETDFAYSPEYPFIADTKGKSGLPTESETYISDAGPFGKIDGSYKTNSNYEQIQWLQNDLANVDSSVTPWIIAMSHRPMYSTNYAKYQENIQDAFQDILLQGGVDLYISGHIHWYERLYPIQSDGSVDQDSVVDDNTYYTNAGTSMTHIINGQAGNVEAHTTLSSGESQADFTAVLDDEHYGFSTMTIQDATTLKWAFTRGDGTGEGDFLTLIKGASDSDSNAAAS